MCKKLRKVTFTLNYKCGFTPNQSPQEEKEHIEQESERNGFFHEWASTSDNDENVSFRINKVGIIEEAETGQVYCVFPDLIKFIEPPHEENVL